MDALTRVPLSQQAAEALLGEISGGRWEVGQQLPGEVTLARELGIGRSTIREAIRLLAARGVLATRQGVGVFLVSTVPVLPWDRVAELSEISELLQVRIAIESRAAALAAGRGDAGAFGEVRRALERRDEVRDASSAELAVADVDFHRAIVRASGNAPLLALFDSLVPRLVAAMTGLLDLVPFSPSDADDHAGVVDAIVAGDAARAETVTREHLLGLARTVESVDVR